MSAADKVEYTDRGIVFTQTVWIEPLVESEFDDVRKLIDEHSDAFTTGAMVHKPPTVMIYYVEGTVHDVERVRKQFRRLNRGPIKFKAVW